MYGRLDGFGEYDDFGHRNDAMDVDEYGGNRRTNNRPARRDPLNETTRFEDLNAAI